MRYIVYYSNAGTPVTLLTPTIDIYKTTAGVDVTPIPTVYEIGGGFYRFDASPSESIAVRIDGDEGAALSDGDRYKVLQIAPNDTYLDYPVSSRASAEDLTNFYSEAPSAVWEYADRSLTDKTDFVLSSQTIYDLILQDNLIEDLAGSTKFGYYGGYNPWSGANTFSLKQGLTLPRSYDYISGIAHSDNRLYLLMHVKNSSTSLYDTYVYKGGNNIWNKTGFYTYLGNFSSITFAYMGELYNLNMVSYGGYIWVFGVGEESQQIYKSSDGVTWAAVGTNTLPTFYGRVTVHDNKMWNIGGFNAGWTAQAGAYYSTDGITWTLAGNLPSARFSGGLVSANSKLVFVGGYDADWNLVDTVYTSTNGVTWTTTAFPEETYETQIVSLPYFTPDAITVVTYNATYYSTDGTTWTQSPELSWSDYPFRQGAVFTTEKSSNAGAAYYLGGQTYTTRTHEQYDAVIDIKAITDDLPDSVNEHTDTIALSAINALSADISNIDLSSVNTFTETIVTSAADIINTNISNIDLETNVFTETIVTSAMNNINANVDALEEYVGAATGDILNHFDDMVLDFYAEEIEATVDLKTALKIILACMVGKASGADSLTPTFRSLDDAKNRVTMAVDRKGNRTTVTLDLT